MVTKEEVEKAFAEYKAADTVFLDESKASDPLDWVATIHAWDKYRKLKQEFENESESTQTKRGGIEYTVRVCDSGGKYWYLNGKRHCEHGPSIEWANGAKFWYLNDKELTEAEFNNRMNKPCSGKVVEIEGVKYKLVEV